MTLLSGRMRTRSFGRVEVRWNHGLAPRPHSSANQLEVIALERSWSTELALLAGQRVLLKGWLHHVRVLSNRNFLILRDGRGLAQVVVEDPKLIAMLADLPRESVLEVEGDAVAEPQAPGGAEIKHARIQVLVQLDGQPPVQIHKKRLNVQLPTLLDHAALTLRHPERRSTFRIASASVEGFRSSLSDRDFVEIHTPKIVGSATEGGANVFTVDYFGRRAYLAQSPQFYKQTMVGVFERVFEVGPVFRAEPHDTPRHTNEYTSLDIEMGFIEDHRTVMSMLRDVVGAMVQSVRDLPIDPAMTIPPLPAVPAEIPSIHFADAQQIISETSGESLEGELDLAPSHETLLGEWALQEHGSEFLFVTGYPMAKRPFYTHPDPSHPVFSNSFDLLFRGLEVVTGGQRLHLYADYMTALSGRGLDATPFAGYLEAFRYGMPPHGGFAIGLGRWVAQMTGATNVRETTLFPRDLGRLAP